MEIMIARVCKELIYNVVVVLVSASGHINTMLVYKDVGD